MSVYCSNYTLTHAKIIAIFKSSFYDGVNYAIPSNMSHEYNISVHMAHFSQLVIDTREELSRSSSDVLFRSSPQDVVAGRRVQIERPNPLQSENKTAVLICPINALPYKEGFREDLLTLLEHWSIGTLLVAKRELATYESRAATAILNERVKSLSDLVT